MDKKNIIRIINEEINNFDFLNNESFLKEQENIDLLRNEDLQKQFICDSLLNKNDKVKIIKYNDANVGGNWDENEFENSDNITIECNLTISFTYDSTKEPLIFDLLFNGDRVDITVDGTHDVGDRDTPAYNESWFNYINWSAINVSMYTDGDEIYFIAFKNAPTNIKNLFIRQFVEDLITNRTSMDIQDTLNKNIVTQYC